HAGHPVATEEGVERPGLVDDGVHPRRDATVAELELVRQRPRPGRVELLAGPEPQRLARTDARAHRLGPDARAVVTHVALHHQVVLGDVLRDAERARDHAVRAADAPGLLGGLDHAVLGLLDGVSGTDLGAGRV